MSFFKQTPGIADPGPEVLPPSPGHIARSRAWKHLGFQIGAGILLVLVLVAIFAPLLAPHDPYAQSLPKRLLPPFWVEGGNWTYPLGTDHVGRDYFSRLIYGTRVSITIGLGAATIGLADKTMRRNGVGSSGRAGSRDGFDRLPSVGLFILDWIESRAPSEDAWCCTGRYIYILDGFESDRMAALDFQSIHQAFHLGVIARIADSL